MHQPGNLANVQPRPKSHSRFAHLRSTPPPLAGESATPPPPPLDTVDPYQGAALVRARGHAYGVSFRLFLMATAVASVLAVIITFGVVNEDRSDVQDIVPASLRSAAPLRERPPVKATVKRVALLPIGSPSQPLQLAPQRPAQFPLQIQSDGGASDPFILALSGAPPGMILLGVDRISSDTWYLPPGSASRLQIVLPEWSTSVFEIAVVLQRTSGVVAAQTKAWIAVPPPTGAAPAPVPADEAAARELVAKADQLIAKSDIVGARAIYQRATELGSATAALALGATYDPNRLWSFGVVGLAGNKERARHWYQRASELGNAEAKARLTALGF